MLEGLFNRAASLSDGDTFSMTLSIDGFYTNLSETLQIYIKTYEGDNERWVTYHWFEITLMACQGLVAPQDAISAGGEFILDSDGECQWDGAWTYDSLADVWSAPSPEASIELTAPDLFAIIDSDIMLVNGTLLSTMMSPAFVEVAFNDTSFDASAVDKYDLRLDGVWNRSDGLEQGDVFSLGLTLDSIQTNVTIIQSVYINAYGYDSNNEAVLLTSLNVMITVPYLDSNENDVGDNTSTLSDNTAPVVLSVSISPEEALQNDQLTCNYEVYDADGDETVVNITWLVNGVVINTDWQSDSLSSAFGFEDDVTCSVTASDGLENSNSVSASITIQPESSFLSNDADGLLPGFEVWLLILAMLFAVSFRRKLNV